MLPPEQESLHKNAHFARDAVAAYAAT